MHIPNLSHVLALRNNDTVPATVRAAITDYLDRLERGFLLLEELRADVDAAQAAERAVLKSEPGRVIEMLAGGKIDRRKIGAQLEQLRAETRAAEDRLEITRRAVRRCGDRALRSFAHCGPELLVWIARQRVELGRGGRIPPYLEHAWQVARSSVTVVLPVEAYEERVGDTIVRTIATEPHLAGDHRDWWAWQAIAAGLYKLDTSGPVAVAAISAPWTDGQVAPAA